MLPAPENPEKEPRHVYGCHERELEGVPSEEQQEDVEVPGSSTLKDRGTDAHGERSLDGRASNASRTGRGPALGLTPSPQYADLAGASGTVGRRPQPRHHPVVPPEPTPFDTSVEGPLTRHPKDQRRGGAPLAAHAGWCSRQPNQHGRAGHRDVDLARSATESRPACRQSHASAHLGSLSVARGSRRCHLVESKYVFQRSV